MRPSFHFVVGGRISQIVPRSVERVTVVVKIEYRDLPDIGDQGVILGFDLYVQGVNHRPKSLGARVDTQIRVRATVTVSDKKSSQIYGL
ncbi:hypothetical protein TIFTF001_012373 [Ficus carica]|uniref:Uncharacterized protein n=1 Tax=Ficus carica TaxID=3494 RepID=A0AA87ZZW5_FICCA|nr:hypothetical protein TIFTF001_012373 [Ficus carica]